MTTNSTTSRTLQHAKTMMNILIEIVGPDHEYIKDLRRVTSAADDASAYQIIYKVCHDPKIQKHFFPILIDAEAQAEWCMHWLCRYECAPRKVGPPRL